MSRVWCFKCKVCGVKEEWPWADTYFRCTNEECPPQTMVRDYRAERVGFSLENLKAK